MDNQPVKPDPSVPPEISVTEPTVWEFLTRLPHHLLERLRNPVTQTPDTPASSKQVQPPDASLAETPPVPGEPTLQPTITYQVDGSLENGAGGGTKVQISVTLPPSTSLQLTLPTHRGDAQVVVQMLDGEPIVQGIHAPTPSRVAQPAPMRLARLTGQVKAVSQRMRALWRWDLPTTLFGLALIIYLITHLAGLLRYPIYFFSDEAMQPLFAETLIRNRLMDKQNEIFLPLYVEVDGNRWAPLLPMYFHALTMSLFGKTALVTRLTSSIFSILAALSVSLMLKQAFKARFWWLGALILMVTPAWFLHSRTAFETVSATTFYAMFLWLYLRYRSGSPRAIFPALACAAGAFYCYTNAQAVLGLTGLLLLIFDAPYHWQQRRTLVWLLPLGILLALPLLIFEWHNPGAIGLHLRTVDSYWFHDIPLSQKIATLVQKYAYGLSPQYWFFSNGQDLDRHRFGPYPHILTIFLPFFLIGLVVCLRKIRSAPERALLLAALAVPAGAAQLDIGVPRVLMFVIPASVLIALGWEWLWDFAQRWLSCKRVAEMFAHWALLYVFAFGGLLMLGNALENGPLWFRNYGLYGMQYGAVQLFDQEIPQLLKTDPTMRMIVTPTWANGTHRFADFFLSPEERVRVQMGNIDAYLSRELNLPSNLLFIMTPEELNAASANPKLNPPSVQKVLNYPDGTPGFYLVYWSYSPEAKAIFAAERAARMQLIEAEVLIGDEPMTVHHSWIDMGEPQNMFDNDRFTLMRGLEANPFIVELTNPNTFSLSGIAADFGAQDITITATLTIEGRSEPITFSQIYRNVGDPQELVLPFAEGPYQVASMRLEFLALNPGEEVHIHVRELKLLP